MKSIEPATAARLLEEMTRAGFIVGAGGYVDGCAIALNTTVPAKHSRSQAVAAIRAGSPAFPEECKSLLEDVLVRESDVDCWGIRIELANEETAKAVTQFEDYLKGYDRG